MKSLSKELFDIDNCEIDNMEDVTEKGVRYNLVTLNYTGEVPTLCPTCGAALYKHGKRELRIVDTQLKGLPTVLRIIIPRYRCQNEDDKHIWRPYFNSIDEKHKMTRRALLNLTEKSMRTTFEDAAIDFAITANTVKNVFVDFMEENKTKLVFKTPTFIGIDEIKIKKLGEVTVITDLEHRTLFDMLLGRNQKALTEYFMNLQDREEVLWVCSDMYRPFEKSISSAMPNARWTIDHFHVVMKANEAVDAVRREIQKELDKKSRIKTKHGLAYTLKKRLKDLDTEEAQTIKHIRVNEKLSPLCVAYDLKEDFFNIYDDNPTSRDNAIQAFEDWKEEIPKDSLYDKFRELAKTVENFKTQIFQYWDCPIAISNGYTECTNRIIRENNLRGRGYSFEVLRARTLYRKANLSAMLTKGLISTGPIIPDNAPVFHFDSTKESEEYDEFEDDDYELFLEDIDFNPET